MISDVIFLLEKLDNFSIGRIQNGTIDNLNYSPYIS